MLGFLFKRTKKSSNNLLPKVRVIDPFQRHLDGFQTPPQGKDVPSARTTSARQIEDEIDDELKAFQSYVKEVKETSLKLEALTKMLKSGEIPENAYKLIINELGNQLSASVEAIFKLREILELARARAKLEWAKEKIGLEEFEAPERQVMLKQDAFLKKQIYSPLQKWEETISKIDSALSTLTMEEEASIIEQYLSLIKERFHPKVESEEVRRAKAVCEQRLSSISERWASTRRTKIEQIMNLDLKASRMREEIKEVEVRFSVGELDQSTYEYKMSILQGSLKNVEREISDIRNHIDEMDMKIFRCSELLRENP